MKSKFFYGALAVLSLAACSQDEVVDVNRNGDEIKFSVVTNKATRAEAVYSNTNKDFSFNVWASHNNATYIDGDNITTADQGTTWTNATGNRYWPEDGNINFYAANAGTTNWNNGTNPTINFTVKDNVGEQEDLLYAVTLGQNKANNAAGVNMNFRHALSQIVFKAKNTNQNLYVEIYGVTVCNLHKTGTYSYPTTGTGTNFDEDESATGEPTADTRDALGSWATLTGNGTQDYNITWSEAITLTGDKDNAEVKALNGQTTTSMLLLPQTTTAWDPATETNLTAATGTYFLVKCNMYNVKGTEYDPDSDVLVWGKDGVGKEVAIPVEINWTQGNKYVYTFVFDDANGGYDPENPDQPSMTPITFKVTVDDFDYVSDTPVDVKKEENE